MSIGIRRRLLSLEYLEDRTVPATLVSPTTVTYQDIDGDLAQVVFSKPVLTPSQINSLFQFSTGYVDGSNATKQSLDELNLYHLTSAEGNDLSVTMSVTKKSKTGDGQVHLGSIQSSQQALNTVSIQGDLGLFYLNNAADLFCIQKLQVQSLGRFGTPPGYSALWSIAEGKVGTLKVAGDVAGYLSFEPYDFTIGSQAVGSIDIGGSLLGRMECTVNIGSVRIGQDVDGTRTELAHLLPFQAPGSFYTSGTVDQFTVVGSILGGTNVASGSVLLGNDYQSKTVGTLSIGGNVQGLATASGRLGVTGRVDKFSIGGSIIGGPEGSSGQVQINGTNDGTIGGSIVGGMGWQSGIFSSYANESDPAANSIVLKGSLVGGAGDYSGWMTISGPVKLLSLGSVKGGMGARSGTLMTFGDIDQLIMKDLVGSTGEESGRFLVISGTIHHASMGSIVGGNGINSGLLENNSIIDVLTIQNIQGGAGGWSGQITSHFRPTQMTILGSVLGGEGQYSGRLDAKVGTAFLLNGNIQGGNGYQSGGIRLSGDLDIVLKGNIIGGNGEQSGEFEFEYDFGTRNIADFHHFTMNGNLIGGAGHLSGYLSYRGYATTMTLGSFIGGAGESSGVGYLNYVIDTLSLGSIRGGQGFGSGLVYAKPKLLTVRGSIVGGSGTSSGKLSNDNAFFNYFDMAGSVHVLGSIVGGLGDYSGRMDLDGTQDTTVEGAIVGGKGDYSGDLVTGLFNVHCNITIMGNIQGGDGTGAGSVYIGYGFVDRLRLAGVLGGKGMDSGRVELNADSRDFTVQRIIGGAGYRSGSLETFHDVNSTELFRIKVLDSVIGGAGELSGSIDLNGKYDALSIAGSLKGGSGFRSGHVAPHANLNRLILGNIVGGAGYLAGAVETDYRIETVTINGSIFGGSGPQSGVIESHSNVIDQVWISGDIQGGKGSNSGMVYADYIDQTNVAGSVIGGTGYAAGAVLADTRLRLVNIQHDLVGSATGNGGVVAVIGTFSNRILDKLWIAGSMRHALVFCQGVIGSITVLGDITGTAARHSEINVFGFDYVNGFPLNSYTLKSLSVGRDMQLTDILVGTFDFLPDGAANVGTISVGRRWDSSNLIVGYGAGPDQLLGTADDVRLDPNRTSSVDAVFIGNKVVGNSPADSIIQAGVIRKVVAGGSQAALHTGSYNDHTIFAGLLSLIER